MVVNLKGDEVAEHLRQRGVEPRGANVVLKMVEGSTCQAGHLYALSGERVYVNHVWEASFVLNQDYDLILGMKYLTELNLVRIKPGIVESFSVEELVGRSINALDSSSPAESGSLVQFLETELTKFVVVAGKTALAEHRIWLIDDAVPVKQRY